MLITLDLLRNLGGAGLVRAGSFARAESLGAGHGRSFNEARRRWIVAHPHPLATPSRMSKRVTVARELERHLDLAAATTFLAVLTVAAGHEAWLSGALLAFGARHLVRCFHLRGRDPMTAA